MDKTLVVLAGGFGTRLQSILNGLPKPLADINGEPFLKFQFENWIKNGFTDFILSLHFRADLIIDFIKKNKNGLLRNCKIQYLIEKEPLGTGGAIANLITVLKVTDPFFVTNADTWIESGYNQLDQNEGCVIGLAFVNNASRYGTVILNEFNYIINFEEKVEIINEGIINLGLYKLNKNIFSKNKKLVFSLEKELFPVIAKKLELKGLLLQTNFIDIGIPEDYYKFCNLKNKK